MLVEECSSGNARHALETRKMRGYEIPGFAHSFVFLDDSSFDRGFRAQTRRL